MLFKSKYSQLIKTIMDMAPYFDPTRISPECWLEMLDKLEDLSIYRPKLYVNSGQERQLLKAAARSGLDSPELSYQCRKLRVKVEDFYRFHEWHKSYLKMVLDLLKKFESKYPELGELNEIIADNQRYNTQF